MKIGIVIDFQENNKEAKIMGVIINPKLCNGCGKCEKSCPCDVIRIDRNNNKATSKYTEDCMLCGLCSNDCPTNAIEFSKINISRILSSWS
jgi:NAD-dependent dihydropyrimidine dehydrogenase PreA subunit